MVAIEEEQMQKHKCNSRVTNLVPCALAGHKFGKAKNVVHKENDENFIKKLPSVAAALLEGSLRSNERDHSYA